MALIRQQKLTADPAGLSLPLVQAKQAELFAACGLPCVPAGERDYHGVRVPMFRPTGERHAPLASLVGFGGAAYGGKTYGMLLLARVLAALWPGIQIAFFRRTYPELDGPGAAMQEAYEVFGSVAAATDGGKEWNWSNGSAFYFRHCQNEADVFRYQSQQIDVLMLDEATHFTWRIADYLLTRNRASGGGPAGFLPFAVLTSNPGNVGHVWYSQVFDVLKVAGPHQTVKRVLNPNGKHSLTYFVPALLEDNQIGVAQDPGYEGRLMERDPVVAKALRYGDWTIFAGQAFPNWMRDRIACPDRDLPAWWPRWRALDWGYVHPMAAGWGAKDPNNGRIYVYRAVQHAGLTDQEQARLIKELTPQEEQIAFTFASPDMWRRKTQGARVYTSVDEFKEEGVSVLRADDDRVGGKRKIDRLLVDLPDGRPALQVFESCFDVFACMSTLVRAKLNPEDVEKVDGDDPYDMLRYLLTNHNPPAPERRPGEQDPNQNPMDAYFNRDRHRRL